MSDVRWSRVFPGRPGEVAQARRFVGAVLAGWPAVELAELVVSELATNALLHTASGHPGGVFIVSVGLDGDRACVRVWDEGGPSEPVCVDDPDEAAYGRGLLLVSSVAKSWGVEGDGRARRVWAELHVGDAW